VTASDEWSRNWLTASTVSPASGGALRGDVLKDVYANG
jgi:hypothetical protein